MVATNVNDPPSWHQPRLTHAKHSGKSDSNCSSKINGNGSMANRALVHDEEALVRGLSTNPKSASESEDEQAEGEEEEEDEEETEEVTRFRTPDLSWRNFFMQDIANNRFLELQLILLTFATGILDSMTFSEFSTFASKQTGNIVLLTLYAVGNSRAIGLEKNVATSLATFTLGAAVFGHLAHVLGPRRRLFLLLCVFAQTLLVYIATILRHTQSPVSTGAVARATVALLSLSSGGQVALAIALGRQDLNTTMVTGALVQFAGDPSLLKLANAARDRRIVFFGALLAGAFVGALAHGAGGAGWALLVSAIVKTLVSASFLANHGVRTKRVRKPDNGP